MITKPIDGIDATSERWRYSKYWHSLWTAMVLDDRPFSAWVVASLLNEVERFEGVEAVYKGKVYDQAKEIERLNQVLTNSVTQAERQVRLKDEALADRDKKIEKLERDIHIKDADRADIQSLLGSYKKAEQSAWDQLQLARNKVVEQDATIKGLKACNNLMPVALLVDAKVVELTKEVEQERKTKAFLGAELDRYSQRIDGLVKEVDKFKEGVRVMTESRDRWEGWHRDLATKWQTEVVKTTELTKKVEELKKSWPVLTSLVRWRYGWLTMMVCM